MPSRASFSGVQGAKKHSSKTAAGRRAAISTVLHIGGGTIYARLRIGGGGAGSPPGSNPRRLDMLVSTRKHQCLAGLQLTSSDAGDAIPNHRGTLPQSVPISGTERDRGREKNPNFAWKSWVDGASPLLFTAWLIPTPVFAAHLRVDNQYDRTTGWLLPPMILVQSTPPMRRQPQKRSTFVAPACVVVWKSPKLVWCGGRTPTQHTRSIVRLVYHAFSRNIWMQLCFYGGGKTVGDKGHGPALSTR